MYQYLGRRAGDLAKPSQVTADSPSSWLAHVQAVDVSAAALEQLQAELGHPQHLLTFTCDICDDTAQADAFRAHVDRWGGLDAVLLIAGIGESGMPPPSPPPPCPRVPWPACVRPYYARTAVVQGTWSARTASMRGSARWTSTCAQHLSERTLQRGP